MKMMAKPLSKLSVINAKGDVNSAVLFLHGSGDTGVNAKFWMKELSFSFQNTICYFPTAPLRFYSLSGCKSNVWHDRYTFDINGEEDTEGFSTTSLFVHNLLDEIAKEHNIPSTQISLGGFSMGGGISLYSGLLYPKKLSSIFAMSSFLYSGSSLYSFLKSPNNENEIDAHNQRYPNLKTEIFLSHGNLDFTIPISHSQSTLSKLQSFIHIPIRHTIYPNLDHSLSPTEISDLVSFLNSHFTS